MNILEDIEKSIVESLNPLVYKELSRCVEPIKNDLKQIFNNSLRSEPEYTSLKSGLLKFEMGLNNYISIDSIVEDISNSISVSTYNYSNIKKINMSLVIKIFDTEYSTILSNPNALVVDSKRGYSLPWLEWLLLKGSQPIILNYNVELGSFSSSRSGGAIMIRSNNDWSVPTQFAGSAENNWITRALSLSQADMNRTIKNNILQAFK